MNSIKRRLLALGGAIVFFLTGCSYNGRTVEDEGKAFKAIIDGLLKDIKPAEGDKQYKGEDIKIFASYDPSINTYKFNVVEKVSEKAEDRHYTAQFLQSYVFNNAIPADVISSDKTDYSYSVEHYQSLTEENTSATIATDSLTSGEYSGICETITVVDDYDGKDSTDCIFNSKTSSVIVDKNGKNILDVTDVILVENGQVYFGGPSILSNYQPPVISQGYMELSEGTTYSESQLSYLQTKLDEITLSSAKSVQTENSVAAVNNTGRKRTK